MPKRPGPSATTCRSCGAPLLWVRMESGKRMPLDSVPDPLGNICALMDRDTGQHVGWYARDLDKAQRYRSHFATCPHAEKWRQGRLLG